MVIALIALQHPYLAKILLEEKHRLPPVSPDRIGDRVMLW